MGPGDFKEAEKFENISKTRSLNSASLSLISFSELTGLVANGVLKTAGETKPGTLGLAMFSTGEELSVSGGSRWTAEEEQGVSAGGLVIFLCGPGLGVSAGGLVSPRGGVR